MTMSARGGIGRGGRGAYYKNLYGGRGRGKPHINPSTPSTSTSLDGHTSPSTDSLARGPAELGTILGTKDHFEQELARIDGKPYGAYKDLKGVWDFGTFLLSLDRIQSDSYAPPSKARIRVSQTQAGFPGHLFSSKSRNVGLADYITRRVHEVISSKEYDVAQTGGSWADAKGGDFRIDKPGQQVLQRSSVLLNSEWVEARISISLPARGRTILGRKASGIFKTSLPFVVQNALYAHAYDLQQVQEFVEAVEDSDHLRDQIVKEGYVAFIPNGAILPRQSGASDKPLQSSSVVPFQSPESLEKTFPLPNNISITGMAIPAGITTIVGGGFHGKSTLLQAISLGVWNHIPGDGREYVVTNPTAVGVRSEDGRSVTGVDISPFISGLPGGATTEKWSSDDASGSTSMAAGLIEACELGSRLLLFDEDLCATNFMIRDDVMRRLVKLEPITPLIERIRGLHFSQGVSSILVVGGCSDYLIADLVIMMENYRAKDVTAEAHALLSQTVHHLQGKDIAFPPAPTRTIIPQSLCDRSDRTPKPRSLTTIQLSRSGPDLELDALSQLVHSSQTHLIAQAIYFLTSIGKGRAMKEMVTEVIGDWEESMLNGDGGEEGWLAAVRGVDLGMAINRIRGLKIA